MNTALAQRLRDSTQALHRQAERAGIMPALLQGRLPAPDFVLMQRNLHALYAALEPALQQHAAQWPALAAWAQPSLARLPPLAADLLHLHGLDWLEVPLVPATQAYVQRLQGLAQSQPLVLAAHAYVRYLGDLSGGQALGRVVRRSLSLTGADGTRFFDFGPPSEVGRLAAACRQALGALPQDWGDALVDEAHWGFAQHVALFEQLGQAQHVPVGS